jgi:beta-glucosidase
MTERFDVAALVAELTVAEKAALASGSGFWWTRSIPRVAIPSIMVSDGPHGLRKQDRAADHVGIGGSVPATCFPTGSALASTWDPDLVRRVGAAIGAEARAQGVAVVLGPGVNLRRDPRCGRNFEYLSEDPVVAGVLGAALVEGLQSQGVGASLKHFAANNQEHDRLRVSADVDERPLRELYLSAFERIVRDARPWTVMCSYNRINGVYASQDPWLLTEVLRDEWGFDGLVVSDWGAVDDPVAAVAAGLDLEMPSTGGASAARLAAAVAAGDLDEAVLDRAVGRLLGLLDRTLPGVEAGGSLDAEAHHALARAAAAAGTVLLRNEGSVLPLSLGTDGEGATARLAVIGELARTPRYQGAGSSRVNPLRLTDALTALRAAAPDGVEVAFAPGYGVDDPTADAEALRAEAVAAAAGAEVAVVFLGLPPSYESEGYDRTHLDLPADQVALLEAVAGACPRVVVVLANGGVVTAPWAAQADAVVEAWLGGQAGGEAVVDVLLGWAEPSGRLAEAIPLRLQDGPTFLHFPGEDGHVRYGEGLFVGYRHHDAVDGPVAFPFGHGLSYTTFAWSDVEVTALTPEAGADGAGWRGPARIAVEVTVANTGGRPGTEVVQAYVGRPGAAAVRPVRELKAFAKVALEPGASQRVRLVLDQRDLSTWSPRHHAWVLEPGTFAVSVGASSRDLRATVEVAVDGPAPAPVLDRSTTLAEWLDHPVGHDALVEVLRTSPAGDLTPLLDDDYQRRMLGSFPLTRLVAMLGATPDRDVVAELLAQVGTDAGAEIGHRR